MRLDSLEELIREGVELIPTHQPVLDRSRLRELLQWVHGAVLDVERVDDDVLDGARSLRVLSRFGVGYDAISIRALRERGISLCNTPGVMAEAVARQALALALTLVFRCIEHDRALKQGIWERKPNLSVSNATFGVVGLGPIGRATARLASAMGFRVIAYSRSSQANDIEVEADLDKVIDRSDIVSLHLVLNAETEGMMGAERLAGMRGKYLVNTARGRLVDEAAVCRALDEGTLAGYATDVFASEPVQGISARLAAHPAVTACPHVGAYDDATSRAMLERAVLNAVHSIRGEHDRVKAYVYRAL